MAQVASMVVGALTTPEGRAAIDRAVAEATAHETDLVLVGHIDRPRDERESETYLSAVERRREEVESLAAEVAGHGVQIRGAVPYGAANPAESILTVAQDEGASLIVVGVRQRSRVGKFVLGSNVQDIILKADCPVLAVKAEDAP